MRCPNCNAECSDQASECEFCGHQFGKAVEITPPLALVDEQVAPPPLPDFMPPPPLPSSFESDNPYAASDSSSYGRPQLPAYDVPNHLPLSITAAVLTLCCCCIPFGVVPLIFSTQVNSKLASGDYAGAQSASDNAKLWSWISIGIALLVFVLNLIMQFVAGMASLAN
ncbi:MAG: CD225/dispanin family protein [Arenimonas sp.]